MRDLACRLDTVHPCEPVYYPHQVAVAFRVAWIDSVQHRLGDEGTPLCIGPCLLCFVVHEAHAGVGTQGPGFSAALILARGPPWYERQGGQHQNDGDHACLHIRSPWTSPSIVRMQSAANAFQRLFDRAVVVPPM